MLLHWDQMVLHYGSEIMNHRPKFEAAGMTTYGLLCCRFTPNYRQLSSSPDGHAEAVLLGTEAWREDIPRALAGWDSRGSPMVVTMALNRSPCGNCSGELVRALNRLHNEFPVSTEENRFILAARGAYADAAMVARTTSNDLVRLRDAGWELCVL